VALIVRPSDPEYNPYRYRPRNESYVQLEKKVLTAVTSDWQVIKDIADKVGINRQSASRILVDLHRHGFLDWLPTLPTQYRLRQK